MWWPWVKKVGGRCLWNISLMRLVCNSIIFSPQELSDPTERDHTVSCRYLHLVLQLLYENQYRTLITIITFSSKPQFLGKCLDGSWWLPANTSILDSISSSTESEYLNRCHLHCINTQWPKLLDPIVISRKIAIFLPIGSNCSTQDLGCSFGPRMSEQIIYCRINSIIQRSFTFNKW